jgi:NAD(P)-dependent dehydrogenase (short-subunit alcohol dehydrogenase family)
VSADNSFNPFSLKGKRVLVTGASSGIGLTTALNCARMGAEIIATGRDRERLTKTFEELQSISSLDHKMVVADLTVAAERDAVIAALDSKINGLVHAAGISRLSPTRMMTESHLQVLHRTNVEAPFLLTQGILRRNLVAADGAILFIASIAAHIGVAGVGGYSGTKAALIAMARCLATEVAKHRIRVNCLSPALVHTPLVDDAEKMISMDTLGQGQLLGFGMPDDVANACIFMLSDASRWITGSTLIMDGGLTL